MVVVAGPAAGVKPQLVLAPLLGVQRRADVLDGLVHEAVPAQLLDQVGDDADGEPGRDTPFRGGGHAVQHGQHVRS
jgi:hypothetical protein